MTEKYIEQLGFELTKEYPHHNEFTKEYKKGSIKLEKTFLETTLEIVRIHITVNRFDAMGLTKNELKKLDMIVNK